MINELCLRIDEYKLAKNKFSLYVTKLNSFSLRYTPKAHGLKHYLGHVPMPILHMVSLMEERLYDD